MIKTPKTASLDRETDRFIQCSFLDQKYIPPRRTSINQGSAADYWFRGRFKIQRSWLIHFHPSLAVGAFFIRLHAHAEAKTVPC
jgi:hypothetical protein